MLDPTTVIEIGCGLGENLALIQAPQRYGFDVDEGVIKAAQFLRGKEIQFAVGSFSEVMADTIDVLILINWIHELSPSELETQLAPLLLRTRYLLLDAIDKDGPVSYRFKHDFKFLDSISNRLSSRRPANEGRSFNLFEIRA
ncbi:hypothetical protein AMST5_03881 [freshwater sediment metagenome]|uniref:Methyltransferase domain-containing protein n=1 Tax=freshwater sediment metagenome TaxID=556182 RepID=A0AA48RBW8_9ZZZZ